MIANVVEIWMQLDDPSSDGRVVDKVFNLLWRLAMIVVVRAIHAFCDLKSQMLCIHVTIFSLQY